MAKDIKEKKIQRNPIIWFLFAILIPIIITILLTTIILFVADVDVFGWAKTQGSKIPVISTMVKTDEEIDLEAKLKKANEKMESQNEQLLTYEDEIENLETTINDLEVEISKLKKAAKNESVNKNEEDEQIVEYKDAASSFRKMDRKSAAEILQNLDKRTAASILSNLSGEVRGEILAEMEPKTAATLMEELLEQ